MAVQKVIKPIIPKVYPASANAVKSELRMITRRTCEKVTKELRHLVETWDSQPQPDPVTVQDVGNDLVGTAVTNDKILYFIDGGTAIRWALMKNPYYPKTSYRNLRSNAGTGGKVAVRGKGAMTKKNIPPFVPGLSAREFSQELEKIFGPIYSRDIDAAMAKAIKKGQAAP